MTHFKEIVNKYLTSSCLWLTIIALALFLLIWRFSSPNYLILGGEGNYFLNLPETKSFGFTWSERNDGTGGFTRLIHSSFLIFDILACLQRISLRSASLFNAFFVYYLPFFFFFILLKKCLKLNLFNSLIISLFYILNPFSSYYLVKLSFWETAILFILPIFFIVINQNFNNPLKLFIYFGMISFVLSFGFANLPLLGIALLSVPLILVINSLKIKNKLDLRKSLVNLILLAASFFLFNFWWLANFFFRRSDLLAFYPKSSAISWAGNYQPQNIFSDLFSLRWLFSSNNRDYNFFSHFYQLPSVGVFLFLPIIMLFFYFWKLKKRSQALTVLLFFLLISLFLTAGASSPFGDFYFFLMKAVPLFMIFKSPWEKFGTLLIFLIAISFGFLLTLLDNKPKKYFYRFFVLYLVVCLTPFFTNNFIPESKIHESKYSSRRFFYKKEYQEMIKAINSEKNIFRVMSLPGTLNYQVTMQNHGNKYYRGMDPLMYGLNKSFIATSYNLTHDFLFTNLSDSNWRKVLSLYNIGNIFLNKDVYPSFGFLEKESPEDLEKMFDQEFECSKKGAILLCDNDFFLPRFYIPQKTIYVNGNMDNLLDVVGFGDWEIRSEIFLEDINGSMDSKINELENSEVLWRVDKILVKGELKNAISQEELGSALSGGGDLPHILWRPNSLLYPLLLKKEEYDKWKVRNEPEKLFEKHLFYSLKRIAETEKFANKMDDQLIRQMAEQYQGEMIETLGVLEELKQSKDKNFLKLLLKFGAILRGNRKKIKEIGRLKDWEIVFGELEKKIDKLRPERDFSQLVYKLNVPRKGKYKIFITNSVEPEIEKIATQSGNGIDKLGNLADKWIDFGETDFEKGEQEWALPIKGISENLVDENLKIKDYSPDSIYRISFDYKASRDGGFFVAEGNSKETARIELPSTGDEFGHFEMFFRSSSEAKDASVHLSISIAQEENLKVERIYQPKLLLRLKNNNENTEYKILNTEDKILDTRNQILDTTDIRDRKLDIKGTLPKITFVKINPTKYRVKVEGAKEPYSLVFSESFHQGWKAYINKVQSSKFKVQNDYGETVTSYFDGEIKEGTHKNIFLDRNTFETLGKKPISDEKHLLVNSYANSWNITPEDSDGREDYEVIIEFAPQKLFYFGLGISLITLLGSIIWLIFARIKRTSY